MTPGTTKRTTFKEKSGADARAIVHRKTSDIENYSFHDLQIEKNLDLFRVSEQSTQPTGEEAFAVVVIQISFNKILHDQ